MLEVALAAKLHTHASNSAKFLLIKNNLSVCTFVTLFLFFSLIKWSLLIINDILPKRSYLCKVCHSTNINNKQQSKGIGQTIRCKTSVAVRSL